MKSESWGEENRIDDVTRRAGHNARGWGRGVSGSVWLRCPFVPRVGTDGHSVINVYIGRSAQLMPILASYWLPPTPPTPETIVDRRPGDGKPALGLVSALIHESVVPDARLRIVLASFSPGLNWKYRRPRPLSSPSLSLSLSLSLSRFSLGRFSPAKCHVHAIIPRSPDSLIHSIKGPNEISHYFSVLSRCAIAVSTSL
jgi:hypothetical protein